VKLRDIYEVRTIKSFLWFTSKHQPSFRFGCPFVDAGCIQQRRKLSIKERKEEKNAQSCGMQYGNVEEEQKGVLTDLARSDLTAYTDGIGNIHTLG
jgi:hypothetical protein